MKKEITQYSLPYATIVLSLRIALVEYFKRHQKLQTNPHAQDELEARRIMITILSAALCEACINTWLALNLEKESFELIERSSTIKKWMCAPKFVIPTYTFPNGTALHEDLVFVFDCRNSVMHAKSDISGKEEIFHKGNFDLIDDLKHDRILRIASVAEGLLKHLAEFDRSEDMMRNVRAIEMHVGWNLALHEFQ